MHFSSVAQSCLTLGIAMDCIMPGIPVHPQIPELTQTHVHWVSYAIQPSYPLSSPSPPAFNLSPPQGLFQGVSSSFFFSFVFISWRLINLQYCSGFCHTLKWISHGFTSRSPLPPPSPPDPSRSTQFTRSECLSHASNLGWWSLSP